MKHLVTFLLAISLAFVSKAQITNHSHELGFHLGGGISALHKIGIGGVAGGNFIYFLDPQWGIGTGVEISLYTSKLNASGSTTSIVGLIDDDEDRYDLNTFLEKYIEKQRAYYLSVPLFVQFQVGVSDKHQFYARTGLKLGMPLSATYSVKNAVLENTGYYDDYQLTPEKGKLPYMGFGTYYKTVKNNPIDLKLAVSAGLEMGVKWTLAEKKYLYSGLYFDYSINDVRKSDNVEFLRQSLNPENFSMNSLLLAKDDGGSPFANKVHPWSFGAMLRLTFDMSEEIPVEPGQETTSISAAVEPEIEYRVQKDTFESKGYDNDMADLQEMLNTYPIYRTQPSRSQRKQLDKKVSILKYYPDLRIVCTGYTSDKGIKQSVNKKACKRRAQAIRKYLVSQGIDKKRIVVKATGKRARALFPGSSERKRAQNRRVEFKIIKAKETVRAVTPQTLTPEKK